MGKPRAAPAALALAAMLGGCAAPPADKTAATPPVSADWPADTGAAGAAPGAAPAGAVSWQRYFADAQLRSLIALALANSRDLRAAVLRVREARARYGVQRADRFPGVSADGQAARSRTPGDLNESGRAVTGGEYRVEAGLAAWELDLWGRVASLSEAALQEYLASASARRAARVALIAEVADGYLNLRALDERIDLAGQTLRSREASQRIFARRTELGATSRLELAQVETLLLQARALAAQLEQERAAQAHALSLLAGAPVDIPRAAHARLADEAVFAGLDAGLPADLLANRPDIEAAERRLAASRASVRAARAAFFPRIALTGAWGTASAELDGLFDAGSRAWSFVPTISLPIFDGGRRRANLDLAQARSELAVADYERTIQQAFREVSDALSAGQWLGRQVAVQRETLAVQAERARLAQLRYDSGAAAYLEVLDAQRDLLQAQQQLVQLRRELLASRVSLYAALGGGAPDDDEAAGATPAYQGGAVSWR